jgi:hypothetical protein
MMKRDGFQSIIDGFKKREPFRPFVIELDNGQRLTIENLKYFQCFAGTATYMTPDHSLHFVDPEDVKQVLDAVDAA